MSSLLWVTVLGAGAAAVTPPQARITVWADRVERPVSRFLTGACIEDVNHEIYGGLYSQMIFGESFQEPPPATPVAGFTACGGSWGLSEGVLEGGPGDGPKLVLENCSLGDGEAGVAVRFDDAAPGLAGLIVRVGRPRTGADAFDGYEIALDPSAGIARIGRHQQNYTLLQDAPCAVPIGEWVDLRVRLSGPVVEVFVNGARVARCEDPSPLPPGSVGLRQWRRGARYRGLWVGGPQGRRDVAFAPGDPGPGQVSSCWRLVRRGDAHGYGRVETDAPFVGRQSQRLTFAGGTGALGLVNEGLNRRGMAFAAGRPCEGCLWARAEAAQEVWACLETRDGRRTVAEQQLTLPPGDWQKLTFTLTPSEAVADGRFTIELRRPGSAVLGYVRLEPGAWGRFRGLPVRRDVAEALVDQGITVLRYGGSMVNAPAYRWKRMIGPRERRPPYAGTWYPYSTNGWGIPDFIAFCRAAGFLCIPAFHMGETPQDMADFVEYANGPVDSPWGARRAADGFPEPFGLRYLQLGNEERVDEAYAEAFVARAEAIWDRDPSLVLVVGDFVYTQPIADPMRFTGALSGITSFAGHRRILAFAKQRGGEVWFDVHIGTEGPGKSAELLALGSVVRALEQIAEGARHRVVAFEFNAGNHQHRRALANAQAIHEVMRLGLPVATSANCLQPDGQNDNGWDQGLLFLDPSKVWLQPPGCVTRMVSRAYEPLLVRCEVEPGDAALDVVALRSEDGRGLTLSVVNTAGRPVEAEVRLAGFAPARPEAELAELAGPLDACNSAAEPSRLTPAARVWVHDLAHGSARLTLAPRSYTTARIR